MINLKGEPVFGKIKAIHFVGIGGIGMSGIAEVLVHSGFSISGSDLKHSSLIERLESQGVTFHLGHQAAHVDQAQLVVTSTAVSSNNPEVMRANELGIPIISRGEMLAELMRLKRGIAIGGSHGKTSTTSMTAQILSYAGLDPTIVIGGKLGVIGSNAKLGQGEYLVAEADESDGSFLRLSPVMSVITNIDREHLDYYSGLPAIQDAFIRFGNSVPFYGRLFLCADDSNTQAIAHHIHRPITTFGIGPKADLRSINITQKEFSTFFDVEHHGVLLGSFSIQVPGHHMVTNALAAIGIALELSIPLEKIREALATFRGADRRFSKRGEKNDIIVVDDYGHHPTEIEATLEAARQGFPSRRIIAVFQPHRYSRTQALLSEFSQAFPKADMMFMCGIYPAGEAPIEGFGSSVLFESIAATGIPSCFVENVEDLPLALAKVLKPHDLVITFGAGTITHCGPRLLDLL